MDYSKQIAQIPLYNQYNGKFPVLAPDYKDKQYISNFEKIKTIIEDKQYTLAANHLAELVLNKLSSNYNCWYVKRMCFEKGLLNLETELTWTRAFLLENVKNFQGWEYRRFLKQKEGVIGDQLDYLDQILKIEQKNYHVWAYKVLLASHFNLFEEQKVRILKWIELDIMNNSAWSFRHFLLSNTIKEAQQLEQQILFIFQCINKNINNMSVWNYLRGWFPSIKLNDFSSQKSKQSTPIFEYKQFPKILQVCLKMVSQNQKAIQAMITLVHIHSHQPTSIQYAISICEMLSTRQKQKQTYWKWIQQNLLSLSKQMVN